MIEEQKSIVPVPVLPLVSPEKAAEQWALFESLKAKLLGCEDYQTIAGKRFIKRSGFRKIAVYFGISDRLVKEERSDRNDGSFSWRVVVEAFAPNGRSCIGVGACDSRERKFAHLEHDVYATAHTRAKSRAISDLVAGGVVSAEEVEATAEVIDVKPESASENAAPRKDEPVDASQRQIPLIEGLQTIGRICILGDETTIIPEIPVKKDEGAITGFLISKVLEPMCTKHGFAYSIIEKNEGGIDHILLKGALSDAQVKEIQTAARWAFSKAESLKPNPQGT